MAGQKLHPNIAALTGVRAVAAYLVFFHHYTPPADVVGVRIFSILWQGSVGVSIFFVLSGFLIAYNYADSVVLERGWLLTYLRNRFAKIYPLHLLTTAVALMYLRDYSFEGWFYNLTLLRGFFERWYFYHIGQAWSLSVEALFYILAPVLLLLIGRVPLGLLCLFFYLSAYFLHCLGAAAGWEGFFAPFRMVAVNTFFGRCFEFLLGAWLFIFFRRRIMLAAAEKPPRAIWTYFGAFSVAVLMYLFSDAWGQAIYSANWSPVCFFIFPMAVALFFFGLCSENSAVSRILGSKAGVVLGQSSYAFYLLHAEPFREMLGIFGRSIWLHFITINLISIAVFYFFERPVQRILRSRGTGSLAETSPNPSNPN